MRQRLFLVLVMPLVVLSGCQSESGVRLSNVNLPRTVGGVNADRLVYEIKDAPVLEIKFDEIVLSNGQVTVTGFFTGLPKQRLTVDPLTFSTVLSGTILLSGGGDRPFRLVGDCEFLLVNPSSLDKRFEESGLHAGGDQPVRFSHSYDGFPSDADAWSDKTKMNIISRFADSHTVTYCLRSIVFVRYADQSYGYPNEDESVVNIRGEGVCEMKVVKDVVAR